MLLAKEATTLDLLSDGRFELGLGAGRPSADRDHRMLGIPFGSGGERVNRLAESIGLIKALLEGQRVDAAGPRYSVADAAVSPGPVQRPRPPLLVAGSGARLLALAGREADSVALGVAPDATKDALLEKIVEREAAGERFSRAELGSNLVAVGDRVVRYAAAQLGADAGALARGGAVSALAGSPDEMCERLLARRERLGLSYYLVSDELIDTLAPVVERLAGR